MPALEFHHFQSCAPGKHPKFVEDDFHASTKFFPDWNPYNSMSMWSAHFWTPMQRYFLTNIISIRKWRCCHALSQYFNLFNSLSCSNFSQVCMFAMKKLYASSMPPSTYLAIIRIQPLGFLTEWLTILISKHQLLNYFVTLVCTVQLLVLLVCTRPQRHSFIVVVNDGASGWSRKCSHTLLGEEFTVCVQDHLSHSDEDIMPHQRIQLQC